MHTLHTSNSITSEILLKGNTTFQNLRVERRPKSNIQSVNKKKKQKYMNPSFMVERLSTDHNMASSG